MTSGTSYLTRCRPLLSKYTALSLNLGNFSRGPKRSAPSAYADHIDCDSSGERRGVLIKSIAPFHVVRGFRDFAVGAGLPLFPGMVNDPEQCR